MRCETETLAVVFLKTLVLVAYGAWVQTLRTLEILLGARACKLNYVCKASLKARRRY